MDVLALLADKGIIDRKQIPAIQHDAGDASATPASIEAALSRSGIPSEAVLAAKGEYYEMPTRTIADASSITFDVLRYVPEESARYYGLAPLGVVDGALELGITDPDNLEARDVINFISNKAGIPYKLFLVSETDFAKVLERYSGLGGEVGQALGELETEIAGAARGGKGGREEVQTPEGETITETGAAAITEDAPVTKIVATVVRHAVEEDASDIHIEAMSDRTRVRFRVDGALSTYLTLPQKIHPAVVTRIKVLSNMRLDERRKPQDGRFSARVGGNRVDFRVSTFPTYWGEKVEMRILGSQSKEWTLDKLGLSERNLKLLREAVRKPYGLVLISGPTGSGKSTTLYSVLSETDTETKNVLSLEDPVEYTISGVSQSQVRPEIGYTFATGLRTTLRQDPNIIMVGEIRDKETAELAVQAALTGHLVLSTIHTNDSIGIVPRLLDMGVDPYLIPPTLILGVAQRLVRTLCPSGGEKVPVEGSLKEMLNSQFADLPKQYRDEIPPLDHVYRLKPTKECPSGTRGRTSVVEMFEMTPELERAILAGKSQQELYQIVRKEGMLTIKENAIIKSAQGIVPFEEVNTVGGEFDFAFEEEEAVEAVSEGEGELVAAKKKRSGEEKEGSSVEF